MVVLLLQILGAGFEVAGVYLMANLYFTMVMKKQIPVMIIHALWRGSKSRDGVSLSDFSEENKIKSLQGLAFIGLGFLIQLVASLISLINLVMKNS